MAPGIRAHPPLVATANGWRAFHPADKAMAPWAADDVAQDVAPFVDCIQQGSWHHQTDDWVIDPLWSTVFNQHPKRPCN